MASPVPRENSFKQQAILGDPLPPHSRQILSVPPAQRDQLLLTQLIKLTQGLAGDFFGTLSEAQHVKLAKTWRYQFFGAGEDICLMHEQCAYLFVVLHGECVLTERQVSHLEGRSGTEGHRRRVVARRGRAFGHYPLVHSCREYDYSARVDDSAGCCVLLIPRACYVQNLKKEIEKQMSDTVALLKANKTFAPWSTHALSRLFFWFSKRRYAVSEDIVKQGDTADFCFIIRAGSCDVLVAERAAEATAHASDAAASAPAAQPRATNAPTAAPSAASSIAAGRPPPIAAPTEDGGVGFVIDEVESPSSPGSPVSSSTVPTSPLAKLRSAGRRVMAARAIAALRHVVTLQPGAIVGEIALVAGVGARRNATVRAARCDLVVELLILDKRSFLDLDPSTLQTISDEARYRTACTRTPEMRDQRDLAVLMSRTAHLTALSGRSAQVHYELCRSMVYRELPADQLLVRKGAAVKSFFVLMSGACHAYNAAPRGRQLAAPSPAAAGAEASSDASSPADAGAPSGAAAESSVGSYLSAFTRDGVAPVHVVRQGETIGETELLQADPVAALTVVTTQPVEIIELERAVFDRVLRDEVASESGRVLRFLQVGRSPNRRHSPLAELRGHTHAHAHAHAHATCTRARTCPRAASD